MDNSPASMLRVMGGSFHEGLGKSWSGHVDSSSMFEEGGGEKNYFNNVEKYLGLVREDCGGEVDRNKLEHYFNELEQCLELPMAVGASSAGGAEENRGIDGASLFRGPNDGNIFEQYSDLLTVVERAFSCSQHFAFDAFRDSSTCPPL